MIMYYRVLLSAQRASRLDESKGTHVRVYEREDDSIREAVPPIAQEGGWHTCGKILSGSRRSGWEHAPNAR